MTSKVKTPEELAEESFNDMVHRNPEGWDYSSGHELYVFGFEAGYEAARPKWVKTEEQLPEMSKDVLCFCYKYYAVGCCVPNGTWTDPEEMDLDADRFKRIVKAWCKLPEPPKDL